MTPTLTEGAALLVAGFGTPADQSSGLVDLGQIGEVLLASATPWRIRRLADAAGERHEPSRASLRLHIEELTRQPGRALLLAMTAMVTGVAGAPALVTGRLHDDYPEDQTLPLAWLRERLGEAHAELVIVILSVPSRDGVVAEWLRALATGRPEHLVAVAAAREGAPLIGALLQGLCGAALDPETGTVTPHSLGEHLARIVPDAALQRSPCRATLTAVPPLGDARLSRAYTAPASQAPEPRAGRDLEGVVLPGRFRIERPLARGSFGVVYRARQLAVERDVAVKVLADGVDAASEDGRLFVHEIQSVGRLDHPNVVRIFQADATPDGRLFFAMELLIGRDLQQILDEEGVLDEARAVSLAGQLLAGLGAAHVAGLIHADIKPANAFVVAGSDGERVVLIDFGLARLKPAGRAAESAGGTPAYMAPEQLHNGRVDARSDLFSAALVMVTMLTGWRRRRADDLVPPLAGVRSAGLRAILERALALDPGQRYQTAADFAGALVGKEPGGAPAVSQRPPFRHLAPFTERDHARLFGRDADIAVLTEHVLYRRAVVYTAPSGVGKTSLLRAGLVPRLEALGTHTLYFACRTGVTAGGLATAVWPGATSLGDAIASWVSNRRGQRLVLIVDQLEAVLGDDGGDLVAEVVAFARWPADADVALVLSVREDFLARLVGRAELQREGVAIVRLGPLGVDGARAAIVGPLTEQRLAMAPDLLEALLADLQAAAASLGAELSWGQRAAVYPPHLQLAGSVLYDALGAGEAVLTLAGYRRLGGLGAIVGEYLERVLDTELDARAAAAAREVFLALVTAAHTRTSRPEAELLAMVAARHDDELVRGVLETLRARGLLVRVRAASGDPVWELVHDSLVPRVHAWIDRRDLARRRAVELVRYHLRRSRPAMPSLLGRPELREIEEHGEAIASLEEEWRRREEPWTPLALVAASRRALRRRLAMLAGLALLAIGAAGVPAARWLAIRAERRREESLRDRDLGRFALALAPFDWDAERREIVAVPRASLPTLSWRLYEPGADDPDGPGEPVPPHLLVRPPRSGQVEHLEARGGDAFLEISGRGRAGERCAPSLVPLRRLPGYARRQDSEPTFVVSVPTCGATRAGMIAIPGGPFLRGGLGEPPSPLQRQSSAFGKATVVEVPPYAIDRTEVTVAAFEVFARMAGFTRIAMPVYPSAKGLDEGHGPAFPIGDLTWAEARAYCRFLGKDLPTSDQWEKAMRGALFFGAGVPNPMPQRNFPWGTSSLPSLAKLVDTGGPGPAPVGSRPGDLSPYGVLDMAGNIHEWTSTAANSTGELRVARGGNWGEATTTTLVDFMAIRNPRPSGMRAFGLGVRCAAEGER